MPIIKLNSKHMREAIKVRDSRRTHTDNRQAKKSRRWLLLISLTGMVLLFYGYNFAPSDRNTSTPAAETVPLQTALAKSIQFAWPATGQAAIGSIEDGLLARSSDNERLRPTASMAKVITALAIMEKQPLELGQAGQSYTLTSKDVANYRLYVTKGGSVVPVRAGMVLTQYQAMQAMLIASSNNISDTLVERVFGGTEAYKSYAQAMLWRMGLNQTVVADASGFSPATVSTPSELVSLGIAALKNPVIAEIVAQPQALIPGVGMIKNTNELLGTEGVVGIKTGTTNEAGSCLLFAAGYITEAGQKVTIVGVVMGSSNPSSIFSDSRRLLASAKQGLGLVESQPAGNLAGSSPKHRDQAPRQ